MKRLIVFDFDGCLMNTPEAEMGKILWEKHYGEKYPHIGWWGRKESLDLDVFDIKPFPSILNQLNYEKSKSDAQVIILTSRLEKLRPQIQAILDINNIIVDELVMNKDNRDKGEIILSYIQQYPELIEIDVYDDRDKEIKNYKNIKNVIPNSIIFNIYQVNKDKFSLVESYDLLKVINNEIKNFHSYL